MQVGATDSEDEVDTAEDLQRIEAAAASIDQRMQQTTTAQTASEVEVWSPKGALSTPESDSSSYHFVGKTHVLLSTTSSFRSDLVWLGLFCFTVLVPALSSHPGTTSVSKRRH